MTYEELQQKLAEVEAERDNLSDKLELERALTDGAHRRARAAEAALVATYRLALGDAAEHLRQSTPVDAAPDSLLRWALSDRAASTRALPTPTLEKLMARIKGGKTYD